MPVYRVWYRHAVARDKPHCLVMWLGFKDAYCIPRYCLTLRIPHPLAAWQCGVKELVLGKADCHALETLIYGLPQSLLAWRWRVMMASMEIPFPRFSR